jgi:L-seryl-tRNA(Ser) seleniumtransferase
MDTTRSSRLCDLPSVSSVLNAPSAGRLTERFGHKASTDAIRASIESARKALQAGVLSAPSSEQIALDALGRLEEEDRPRLRPVFNLTGTVLHTNLGRAVLAEAAIAAAVEAMRNAVALEFDVAEGKRGDRDDHVRTLLCELTGAEDATVVNNNAAAVLLCLNTLAGGREAVVSRGELIEIGGAFRMPDIMTRAQVRLVEVGTTNRTHPKDYRSALTAETGVILKVHTSNYRVQGFTSEVSTAELALIAREAEVPLMYDLGSGTLVDLGRFGLQKEPTVREVVRGGADLVTFSGDKLLGGPQAGFIVGRSSLIAAINRNPMKRALRVDKIRLAAIEATLKLYQDPDRLAERLPTLRFLTRPRQEIAASAARAMPHVARALGDGFVVDLCECQSQIGSGALPLETIESAGLSIGSPAGGREIEDLAHRLRALPAPVIGRIEKNRLVLDFRCLSDETAFHSNLQHLRHDGTTRTDAPVTAPQDSPGGPL